MNILLVIPAFGWLLISALFFALGEYLSKQWGMQPSWQTTLMVVGAYALGTLTWLPALLHKNQIAVMGTLWLVLAIVATVAIGVFFYHEQLTVLQWTGVVLALISLVILGS